MYTTDKLSLADVYAQYDENARYWVKIAPGTWGIISEKPIKTTSYVAFPFLVHFHGYYKKDPCGSLLMLSTQTVIGEYCNETSEDAGSQELVKVTDLVDLALAKEVLEFLPDKQLCLKALDKAVQKKSLEIIVIPCDADMKIFEKIVSCLTLAELNQLKAFLS